MIKSRRKSSRPNPIATTSRTVRRPPRYRYAVGIDLGGSSIKAVAVTPDGKTLARSIVPFSAEPMAWAGTIPIVLQHLRAQASRRGGAGEPSQIGVSAPGLVAADGRSIACMPGRLLGLVGLDWTKFLHATRPIPVLNDAHAALLGEAWLGAARGFQHAFLLTLGTGVGGAAMVDGRLLRGHLGRAGHLGHATVNAHGPPDITRLPGSLELAIGNCTIRERSAGLFTTTRDLVAAHVTGNIEATRVWLKSVRLLACALASFINILDPEVILLGGGIAQSGSALFRPLRKYMAEMEWRPTGSSVKLLPAQLGEFAGAFGAAWSALPLAGEKKRRLPAARLRVA